MLKVIEKPAAREASEELLPLDEIAREGARRMLIGALKAEAGDYVERHRGARDEYGRALVVRNGRAQGRRERPDRAVRVRVADPDRVEQHAHPARLADHL